MNIMKQMSAIFAGVVQVAGFMCSMAVAGAALATDKTLVSAIKPCAWWTFEKGMETDRMGQPPFPRLRSDPMAPSGVSRSKQITGSNVFI